MTKHSIAVHEVDIGPHLLGGYCVFVQGKRLPSVFNDHEAIWAAVSGWAKLPKSKRDHPQAAPPHLTDDRAAGRLVFNERGEVIGGVLGGAGLADGKFAAWGMNGKIGEFGTAVEAEAAVCTRAAADAKAKAEAARKKRKEKGNV